MSAGAPSRGLGTPSLLALGVNGIVGVGIFFAPAAVAVHAPGHAATLVFFLVGLALLPVAGVFAVLGNRFPQDGGPVIYARAALGERFAFLAGWLTFVSAVFSLAAVVVGLTGAVLPAAQFGPLVPRVAGTLLAVLLGLVVARGIRVSAGAWSTLTVLKLLPLGVLLVTAAAHGWTGTAPAGPERVDWFRAALTALFPFQGFEVVPVLAGQARDPQRAIPRATVGALVLAMVLYVALVALCVETLPDLAHAPSPLAAVAAALAGRSLEELLAGGISVSALGIAFGMTVTTPHYLAALPAGRGLWSELGRLSRRGVPQQSLVVTVVLVALVVQLGDLAELFALSSIAVLLQYGVSGTALLVLTWRREKDLSVWHLALALPAVALAVALVGAAATGRELLVTVTVAALGWGLERWTRTSAA